MSEMVERCAKALAVSDQSHKRAHGIISEPMDWRGFVDDARAVLQAMRTPTREMEHYGFEAYLKADAGHEGIPIWQAMIDAALNGGPEDYG